MKLRITRVTSSDHGTYHCVAKNDLDVTKGTFIVDGSFHVVLLNNNHEKLLWNLLIDSLKGIEARLQFCLILTLMCALIILQHTLYFQVELIFNNIS